MAICGCGGGGRGAYSWERAAYLKDGAHSRIYDIPWEYKRVWNNITYFWYNYLDYSPNCRYLTDINVTLRRFNVVEISVKSP